jgi:hypothetical protein
VIDRVSEQAKNAELLCRAVDGLNSRDIGAVLELADPEIQFTPLLLELEGAGPLHGHEGLRSWWDDLLGVFPDWGIEMGEVREIGDVTIAQARSHGRGMDSEALIEQSFWQVTEWRDGRAVWWHNYLRETEAIEAARRRQGDG